MGGRSPGVKELDQTNDDHDLMRLARFHESFAEPQAQLVYTKIQFERRAMTTDRRSFLRSAAGGLTAGAGLGLLPATSPRPWRSPRATAPARSWTSSISSSTCRRTARSITISGMLNGVRGFGDPRPQRLPGGAQRLGAAQRRSIPTAMSPRSTAIRRRPRVQGRRRGPVAPGEYHIFNRGRYDRWGHSGELHKRMVTTAASDLPFYYALADAFTVCDAYHCSTMTQTYPNRLHLFTGCNGGGTVGGDPEMSNYGEDETPSADMAEDAGLRDGAYRWTTYAERLQAAGSLESLSGIR
jgi:phospholipase C